MKRDENKGVSLIVLVITIVIMIILASAIILSLNSSKIILKSQEAVLKSDFAIMQEMVTMYKSNHYESIDMSKEYSITEFGITEKKFEEYIDFTIVKSGILYIKQNAPEEVLEVAKELNILVDEVYSSTGSIILTKKPINLRIYGNSVRNNIKVENVGDKTKNLFDKSAFKTVVGASSHTYSNGIYTIIPDGTQNVYLDLNIELPAGTYTYSGSDSCTVQIKNNSGNDLISETVTSNETFSIEEVGKVIRFSWEKNTIADVVILDANNIQIENGSIATEYEPYGYKLLINMRGKNFLDCNITTETSNKSYDTNITEPITISAINNNVVVSKPIWRIQVTYKNGDLAYVGDDGYASGTMCFPKTFNATQDNPIVKITYRGYGMTSGSYNVQVEYGTEATYYESYVEPIVRKIYIYEPLRKQKNRADYIDFVAGEVIRYVKAKDETGTSNIDKNFEILSVPTREKINIEKVDFSKIRNISVNTRLVPSNLEVVY